MPSSSAPPEPPRPEVDEVDGYAARAKTRLTTTQETPLSPRTRQGARDPGRHETLAPTDDWSALFAGMLSSIVHTRLIGLAWAVAPGQWLVILAWCVLTAAAAHRADTWLDHPAPRTGWLYLGGWLLAVQPALSFATTCAARLREAVQR